MLFRSAVDGLAFLEALAGRFAFGYRLLSGEEEAGLSLSGAAMELSGDTRAMLIDVGGGSTEVVIGTRGHTDFSLSMNLGCVRLREKFLGSDPPTADEIGAAKEFVDAELRKKIPRGEFADLEVCLAVAGTVTTLAAVDLNLEAYDREMVHGHVLSRTRVREIFQAMVSMTLTERMHLPSMEAGRADVITAGTLIVLRLLEYAGIDEFTVSEHDILDGAALAMADGRL